MLRLVNVVMGFLVPVEICLNLFISYTHGIKLGNTPFSTYYFHLESNNRKDRVMFTVDATDPITC